MVNECLPMINNDQYNYLNPICRKERIVTLSGSSSDSINNFKCQNRRTRQTSRSTQPQQFEMYNSQNRNGYIRQPIDQTVLNVYADNLIEGIQRMREFSKCSSVVAIDTEFPGVIIKLSQVYNSTLEFNYANVKFNNDLLKPIQIGFSFFDENGKSLPGQSTIQFNFKWNSSTDLGNSDSIDLLKRSGIDFAQLERNGIDPELFAELFMSTGLVVNEDLIWVGFHCAHDWAYILKIVTGWNEMPENFGEFSALLNIHFPKTIDLKTLVNKKRLPQCGLQELSLMYQVSRHGSQHQAGSDSLLTGETYFKFLRHQFKEEKLKDEYYNLIYGLNYCPDSGTNLWQPVITPDDIDSENSGSTGSARSSPYSGNDVTPDDEETNEEEST